VPNPLVLVRIEKLVDQVLALGGHLFVVWVRPRDAAVEDVFKYLLGGVRTERGVA
jgi:hypothetical protein